MIAVFVPTNRAGGLDVLEASIMRQTLTPTHLIVADDWPGERTDYWNSLAQTLEEETNTTLIVFKAEQTVRNAARNLVAAYNQGVNLAQDIGYDDGDLFISLQDYIYVPEEGIERLFWLNMVAPDSLLTGVTNISIDPFPNKIGDINGPYTIFKEPYYDQPTRLLWKDPRPTELYNTKKDKIVDIAPEHWEANWAAIPFKLFNMGARWSEIYDTGYAYENIDFALSVSKELDAQILMDSANEVISLPHREYWPQEAEDLKKYNNRELHERLWSC